ncbi:phospho-sugar mutase [candidate division KSB1 bacterium]|nr:phospho-sugar mutase [candidate division KSB1 bacterium]
MEKNSNSENQFQELLNRSKKVANEWLNGRYDDKTKKQVAYLLEHDEKELVESFHGVLEFGTGGLRGIMGVGTNRMNKYTVGMTVQGLANYLKKVYGESDNISVAIGYDSRNNSKYFSQVAATIFSGNGIKVYIFDELRPLPEISFTLREKGCKSGIMITSSHNPKEYNGIKVFWEDGGQIIPPHDKNIITEVKSIQRIDEVKNIDKIITDTLQQNDPNVVEIGEELDALYLKKIKNLSINPEINRKQSDLKIVYTPIHGAGVRLVPQCLANYGFTNIFHVPEQDIPDGNFPTVRLPNPEETDALDKAIAKAKEVGAGLVMATDPDCDRLAVATKNLNGEFVVLTGNQNATILSYYLLSQWKAKGWLKGNEYIIKTIVTSELLNAIAERHNVECVDVLTGFKWIADIVERRQGKKTFISGGEESIGFIISDFVRDKDAVISSSMLAETAAWAAEQGKTLFELLVDIYQEYGYYKTHLMYIVKKGIEGAELIHNLMVNYREHPPTSINNVKVVKIKDYLRQKEIDVIANADNAMSDLPKSDVLQFYLEDGTKISVRPSGTEPKIKYYFEVKEKLENRDSFNKVDRLLADRIENIIRSMELQ